MKLVLLGTAGFIPTDRAQTACFMLPEMGILLDAGTGLYRMAQHLQTAELDIYLTHAHGDHTLGLFFLFAAYFASQVQAAPELVDATNLAEVVALANQRLHATRLHAPQPVLGQLTQEYTSLQLDWRALQAQEELPGGGRLTTFQVGGSVETGFRLDWPGHSLAYVTDTIASPAAPYLEQIRGVDLLLHECNGPDRLAEMMAKIHHSTTSAAVQVAAVQVAALAGVGRLVLVHKNPIPQWSSAEDLAAAQAIFPNTLMGEDGMQLEF